MLEALEEKVQIQLMTLTLCEVSSETLQALPTAIKNSRSISGTTHLYLVICAWDKSIVCVCTTMNLYVHVCMRERCMELKNKSKIEITIYPV